MDEFMKSMQTTGLLNGLNDMQLDFWTAALQVEPDGLNCESYEAYVLQTKSRGKTALNFSNWKLAREVMGLK